MANDLIDQPAPLATGTDIALADTASATLNMIAAAARDPAVDPAKLRELMQLQREVIADDAKVQFTRALHLAQAEIPPVKKNGTVSLGQGKGSYPFATFEDMNRVLRPVMEKHGFTISFDMTPKASEGGGAVIKGTLTHAAGHSREASIPLALDTGPGRNNLQAMGSTLSYGKRYLCEMFFNIVREGVDDDGVRGGMRFVGPGQLAELQKIIADIGPTFDEDRFFQTMGIAKLENIETGAFIAARNLLNVKLAQKGKQS